jgi:hypothetical protein
MLKNGSQWKHASDMQKRKVERSDLKLKVRFESLNVSWVNIRLDIISNEVQIFSGWSIEAEVNTAIHNYLYISYVNNTSE